MSDVAALGFESEIAADAAFASAATRAIRHIFADRAVIATLTLIPRTVTPTSYTEKLTHSEKNDLSIPLDGVAYAFRVSGCGVFKTGGREHSFNTDLGVFRGFCEKGDTLVFSGDFRYTVYGLTVYSERISDRIADIRIKGEELQYDMTELTDDFLAFFGTAQNRQRASACGVRYEGSCVYIPYGTAEQILIKYRRTPKPITGLDTDATVDIPSETEHLLPLLTAAYLWLDDDRDKAEYYMQLYQSEIASIRRYISPASGAAYEVPNRWA